MGQLFPNVDTICYLICKTESTEHRTHSGRLSDTHVSASRRGVTCSAKTKQKLQPLYTYNVYFFLLRLSSTIPLFLSSLFSFNLLASFFLACSSSNARWGIKRSGSVSSIAREMERLLLWRRKRVFFQSSRPEISSEAAKATRRRSSAWPNWREVSSEIDIYCIHLVFCMYLFSEDLETFYYTCPCFS